MSDTNPHNEANHFSYFAAFWGWTWAQVLRGVASTWREDHEGLCILDELCQTNQPHILAFWHRKFITFLPLFRGRSVCVATSDSTPGNVIAVMCRHLGYSTVQISDNGRSASLHLLEDAFSESMEGCMAVDGPHGPYHGVKRGVIQAASDLDQLIVPITVATRCRLSLAHRWDRLEIPGIFTRVSLVVGEPLRIPPELSTDALRSHH